MVEASAFAGTSFLASPTSDRRWTEACFPSGSNMIFVSWNFDQYGLLIKLLSLWQNSKCFRRSFDMFLT